MRCTHRRPRLTGLVLLCSANVALANLQANLELDDSPSVVEETKAKVLAYNKDDCATAAALRDWLETLRAQVINSGTDVPRPVPGDGAPNEKITRWLIRINALIEKLTAGVPDDPLERTREQQARWILANILDFHRREEKAMWWELFRLSDLSAEDLLDEPAGLSGLTFVQAVGGTEEAPVHRYSFPPQETELRGGEELRNLGGEKPGTIEAVSLDRLLRAPRHRSHWVGRASSQPLRGRERVSKSQTITDWSDIDHATIIYWRDLSR